MLETLNFFHFYGQVSKCGAIDVKLMIGIGVLILEVTSSKIALCPYKSTIRSCMECCYV